MTQADGSRVLVIEDANFTVLSTAADPGGCHGGPGPDPAQGSGGGI